MVAENSDFRFSRGAEQNSSEIFAAVRVVEVRGHLQNLNRGLRKILPQSFQPFVHFLVHVFERDIKECLRADLLEMLCRLSARKFVVRQNKIRPNIFERLCAVHDKGEGIKFVEIAQLFFVERVEIENADAFQFDKLSKDTLFPQHIVFAGHDHQVVTVCVSRGNQSGAERAVKGVGDIADMQAEQRSVGVFRTGFAVAQIMGFVPYRQDAFGFELCIQFDRGTVGYP